MIYAATQWAILVSLTKLTDPARVGMFALALALTNPIYAFLSLNLRSVQATDAREQYAFGIYLGHRLLSVLLAVVVVQVSLPLFAYAGETALVCTLVAADKAVAHLSDVVHGRFQRDERLDLAAKGTIHRGVSNLLIVVGLLWLTGSLPIALAGRLLSTASVLLLFDFARLRRFLADAWMPSFRGPALWHLTRTALPLGLAAVLASLATSTPRWSIEQYAGVAELGVFAALAYLVDIGSTAIRAIGHAFTPRLAKLFATGNFGRFLQLTGVMTGLGAVVGLVAVGVAWAFGEPLLTLVYTADYARHVDLFVLIMVTGALTYVSWLAYATVTAMRMFKHQFWISAAYLVAMAGLCALWVPGHGAMGAAWAWLGARVVLSALTFLTIAVGLRRARRGGDAARGEPGASGQ